jgi:hypothetical protein
MSTLVACLGLFVGQPAASQPAEGLHFRKVEGRLEVVAYLPESARRQIPAGVLKPELGESWLRLHVVDPDTKHLGPPMLGSYRRDGDALYFRPRFALEPGAAYHAEFGPAGKPLLVGTYCVPDRLPTTPPRVLKILPTGDVLPANHLRFYLYFSQPMRGGADIFKEFAVVDAAGKEVLDPWLHDELWDEDDQCLILYIHPGRIKWGVLLRELLGPVLVPDRDYTFVIRGGLRDAQGQTLGKDVVKKFRTTAEDRQRIELVDWKITAPAVGATEPLFVTFPKSLDHKSLGRFLTVHDAAGRRVEGAITIGKHEQVWSFQPKAAWRAAEYQLRVDGRLEDTAGNTPRRPFDVDLRMTPPPAQPLELPFRPRAR